MLDEPLPAVVVAWPEEGKDLRLLGRDGDWRSVPGTSDAISGSSTTMVRPSISPDGRRVAISTDEGVLVIDATAAKQRVIPWPAEIAGPWDTPLPLLWQPAGDGFLVVYGTQAWQMGLDGDARPAPYGDRYPSLAVDPQGAVYQYDHDWRRLLTWDGDQRVDDSPTPQCERLVAANGLVACTTGSIDPSRSGPVVIDGESGRLLGYAPIQDENAGYSDNGRLTSVGFLDDDTVLLLVAPMELPSTEPDHVHLVAWQFRTGVFERIASGGPGMRTIVVAPTLVDQPQP